MFSIGFSGLSLGYAILLAMVLQFGFGQGRVQASLEPVAVVGRWSYNIYLWHYFLPFLVPGYWSLQEQIGNLPGPGLAVLMLQVLVYGVLSIAISAVMTRWVENPALAYRDRWCPSRGTAPKMGSAPHGNAGVAHLDSRLPKRTSVRS